MAMKRSLLGRFRVSDEWGGTNERVSGKNRKKQRSDMWKLAESHKGRRTMKSPFPKIDGAEQMHLARAGVIAEAESIRRDSLKSLPGLNAACIVALAMSLSPGEPAAAAVQSLKTKVTEMLHTLSTSGDELQAALQAERGRLAPLIAAAAHRSLEIGGAVQCIESRIRTAEGHQNGKRDRLMKEGLTGSELDRVAAPFDPSELQAERATLLAEQNDLERFIQTRDPQHLPEGFANEVLNEA